MLLKFAFLLLIFHSTASSPVPTTNGCFPTNWSVAWSRVGNTWFTFMRKEGTWYEMQKQCEKIENGKTTLARPRTSAEHSHLANKMKSEGKTSVWVGGVRLDGSNTFYWYKSNGNAVNLEKMTKTFWRKGEPNGRDGHEDCVHMYTSNYGWNDTPCTSKYAAHCELRCWGYVSKI